MVKKEDKNQKTCEIAENYKEELKRRISERALSLHGENGISQNNGPESLIFVSEATCPREKHFVPVVSDWRLSEDEEKGKWWVAAPHRDPQSDTWEADIIQTAKRTEIPEPTFKEDQFTSIFTGKTFSKDQLKQQIQQNGLRKQLIAVAYHDSSNQLAFRKPTEKEIEDIEQAVNRLTKVVYKNNDQELRKRMDATLGSKELSFNQKLIFFIINQATSQLFKEIDQNEAPETAREIKDLISEGASRFILKNILFTKWDPQQKKAVVFRNTDQTENFPFMVETPLQKVPQQLEASIDSTLQSFKNLFNLLGPQDLEPFMILHPREIAESEIKDNSLKTVIIKAEDAIQWSKVEQKAQKRSRGYSSRYIEFLTDDLLAKIRKGKAETVDRQARKNKLTETFSDIKKCLKDDGILAVLCEEGHGEIAEDVQESLKEAGFEVEGNWEIERSGNEKVDWGSWVVGKKADKNKKRKEE